MLGSAQSGPVHTKTAPHKNLSSNSMNMLQQLGVWGYHLDSGGSLPSPWHTRGSYCLVALALLVIITAAILRSAPPAIILEKGAPNVPLPPIAPQHSTKRMPPCCMSQWFGAELGTACELAAAQQAPSLVDEEVIVATACSLDDTAPWAVDVATKEVSIADSNMLIKSMAHEQVTVAEACGELKAADMEGIVNICCCSQNESSGCSAATCVMVEDEYGASAAAATGLSESSLLAPHHSQASVWAGGRMYASHHHIPTAAAASYVDGTEVEKVSFVGSLCLLLHNV